MTRSYSIIWSWDVLVLLIVMSLVPSRLSLSATAITTSTAHRHPIKMIIIGKIILDEYRSPNDDFPTTTKSKLVVGGGGPQAAWGAAAALAILQSPAHITPETETSPPQQQPIAFLGPVGSDWSTEHEQALHETMGDCVSHIHLVSPSSSSSSSLITPRIQLWHDDNELLQWKPLENSWGSQGADSLWRNRPSAADVWKVACCTENPDAHWKLPCLHMIAEVGATAAGGGQDSQLLQNETLTDRIDLLSVEPVAFPDSSSTGLVSVEDAKACLAKLQTEWPRLGLLSPDQHLYQAVEAYELEKWSNLVDVTAARFGAQGSQLVLGAQQHTAEDDDDDDKDDDDNETVHQIPIASLQTPNGLPVNPTGAGNAYSAALAAALSRNVDPIRAACLASAIGACFCEYDHVPPWTWKVLRDIQTKWDQVVSKAALTQSQE